MPTRLKARKTIDVVVHLPDQRDVIISRYGKGNIKLGPDIYTYSRVPGKDGFATCPGASEDCLAVCYAFRVRGPVHDLWVTNSLTNKIPAIPDECRLLRLHVGGDFSTEKYIQNWTDELDRRQDVTCWAYTRSWRIPKLLPALEELRALPNVQLFASMDASISEMPPVGWRRAWIDGDSRISSATSYVCPEQTGRKSDCQSCRYCFLGQKHDVTFLRH